MIPTSVAIGQPVWYFDTALQYMQTPRAAIVTGVGANPNTVDVTVFANPTWDVANGSKPPLFCRRTLPLLDCHPGHWKVEKFCVLPEFEARYGLGNFSAPFAGTIDFQNEKLAELARTQGLELREKDEEEQATPQKKRVKKKVQRKKGPELPPGEDEEDEDHPDPAGDDEDEFDPAGDGEEDEEDGEEPGEAGKSGMLPHITDPALQALSRHPTFIDGTMHLIRDKAFEVAVNDGPPAKLVFSAPGGCQLATIQYISRTPRGYRLRAYERGQNMDIIVRTAASNGDIRIMLTKLNKILEAGQKARTKGDARKATRAALRRLQPVE